MVLPSLIDRVSAIRSLQIAAGAFFITDPFAYLRRLAIRADHTGALVSRGSAQRNSLS